MFLLPDGEHRFSLAAAQQIAKNIQVRHDADTSLGTEAADLRRGEVPDVSSAENVRLAVHRRVQHGIVIGI